MGSDVSHQDSVCFGADSVGTFHCWDVCYDFVEESCAYTGIYRPPLEIVVA